MRKYIFTHCNYYLEGIGLHKPHHGMEMEMEAPSNTWRMVCCNVQYCTVHHCTVRCHWVEVSCWSWQEIRHQVWRTAASWSNRGSQEDTGTLELALTWEGSDKGESRAERDQRVERQPAIWQQPEWWRHSPCYKWLTASIGCSLVKIRPVYNVDTERGQGPLSGPGTLGAGHWLCSDGAMLRERESSEGSHHWAILGSSCPELSDTFI